MRQFWRLLALPGARSCNSLSGGAEGVEPSPSGSQPVVQKPLHHRPQHTKSEIRNLKSEIRNSAPRAGVEPATSRSKREMMSISPSGHFFRALACAACSHHQAEGEGFEPSSPLRESRVSSAVRPAVSGCLPYQVDPPGIEPGSPTCRAGVFPLDHGPIQSFMGGVKLVADPTTYYPIRQPPRK